ncbi:EAL domain-containing protein [Rugamonas apoptosis]|uniref:EAL domain-containing protein n=1 Tax=Rugamonas apoptosis TaxID=2758570 RepID=A0A7W2F698_9BURK|nr:EAL domain-containing protein [Rugamonas apoptosis]MBA5685948.1 EAL domain-containing protein [Rugamonas apoptosis]
METLQERLQLALEAANMTTWDSELDDGDVRNSTVRWMAPGPALMGLAPEDLSQPFSAFLACVHRADRDAVLRTMQAGVDRGDGYELEFRVVWPDSTLHWLAAKAKILFTPQHQPCGTLGMVWDISRRKSEARHVARQRELAEITLRSIGEGVITTDADGHTLYLNRVAEQLTGWTSELAQGVDVATTLRLVDEEAGADQEHVARKCLRLRQTVTVEANSLLITREGRHIPIEESAAPIWTDDNELLGAVVVFRDVSHERRLTRQLSWQATHDALTGLINRAEFENQLAVALHSAKEEGHVHALLYLDLDQFKVVNDTCGHSAGDLLLQLLAKLLQTQMRDSDILARLGGDELGVLLPHCPPAQALHVAEGLRHSVKGFRFVWDNHSFELGVSIGVVEVNETSKSLSELLVAADQACYQAKERGRNRVHQYQESDARLTQRHGEMLWVSRLTEAFDKRRFRLYAQPIVGLTAQVEPHEEVLVRIRDAKGRLILPGAFIPAAERYDMMLDIDRWVIRSVCRHIQSVRDSMTPDQAYVDSHQRQPARYAINLSGTSIGDDALHDFIVEQFRQYDVAPDEICFEITETAAIANLPAAQEFMRKLKALGCSFSLDDFGSGLSSFAYLKALPVDFLKIDGVFVRDLATNAINRAMVKAINEVGHVMGIRTVAEFVEDDAILAQVRDIGVDYAQGYAVGQVRPLTPGRG